MKTSDHQYLVEFIPKVCKPITLHDGSEKLPEYSGSVTMRIPSWDDRLGIIEKFGSTAEEAAAAVADKVQRMSVLRKLVSLVPNFLVGADIVRSHSGDRLTSWGDISHETALAEVLLPELAWWLLGKHHISSPSMPS